MKTHLFFKKSDQPNNMGQSQKIDGSIDSVEFKNFLNERSDILAEAKISSDKKTLSFVKGEASDGSKIYGVAYLYEHDDDFENA